MVLFVCCGCSGEILRVASVELVTMNSIFFYVFNDYAYSVKDSRDG